MRRILGAMTGPAKDPARARATMVAGQLRARGVTDERVLAAMGAIPREAFVPDASRRDAYADEALPIEAGQTISQPLMVAKMTEHLAAPGDRVLEIGTGLGLPGGDPGVARRAGDLARAPGGPHPAGDGRASTARRRPRGRRSRSARPTAAWATRPARRGTGSS